jgi:hypothetical protein
MFVDYSTAYWNAKRQQSFEGLSKTVHEVYTLVEDDDKPVGDFPSLPGSTHLPVFSENALNTLWDLITGSVETAQLRWINHSTYNIYAVFVAKVVDCLNREKSELKYFSDGGIMDIVKPVFDEEKLRNTHIFRVPDKKVSPVYVSDEFRSLVVKNRLQGLIFE